MPDKTVYDYSVCTIRGEEFSLSQYRGKVLLIVNTASRCGFTPQYEALEELYEKYHARGFWVLGFPSNQFAHQEPGTHQEIEQFCTQRYSIQFPLFEKIHVNGRQTHPLYRYLKKAKPGFLSIIQWNFTKFLVNRQGKAIGRFAPWITPKSLERKIEALLENNQ